MTTDSARMNLWKAAPDVYRGMAAFEQAAAGGLEPEMSELIKIRCSQINKCAFCLDMHNSDARKLGVDQLKIDLLPAWEEAGGLYSARERAALALAESVTLLTDGFVPDAVYARAAEQFDESELARLIAQIVAINAWNRFSVATRAVPASLAEQHG